MASWYFRLNGFLQTPGFVLHSDQARRAITDADILGVRFPYSRELLERSGMADDRWLSTITSPDQTLFVIAEIKKSLCQVNESWTDRQRGAMEKVIRRIGFAREEMVQGIAKGLYDTMRWQNDHFMVQFVAMGERTNHKQGQRYPFLKQLTWSEVAAFMYDRFRNFGEMKGVHSQWPKFGQEFARAMQRGWISHPSQANEFVARYIDSGLPGLREFRDRTQ